MKLVPLVLGLVWSLIATGCGKSPAPPSASPAGALHTNEQMFTVKGVVLEVRPLQKQVRIKHQEVPGYMPAMTMPFDVKDTNELAGIEPGDPVSFRLIVTDTDGWIDRIRKVGPKTNSPPTSGPFRLVRDVEPLSVGDALPEYHFTNQLGQVFSTAGFKGRALAIEFLFTRCPYPAFCPLMARNFEEAQNALLAMTNGPARWHLLSLSFDPDHDTPAVLKAYAEGHHYDPGHWTFATGSLIDLTALGEQVGLQFWHDDSGGLSHNLRAVVIDPSGRVRRIFAGNRWTPEELVEEMTNACVAGRP
jgi:protein SCO1/2